MVTRKGNSKDYWFDREAQEAAAFGEIRGIIQREQAVIAQEKKIFAAAIDELDKELADLRKDVGDESIERAHLQKPMTAQDLNRWADRQQSRLDDLIAQFGEEEGRKIFGMENARTGEDDRAKRVIRRQETLRRSIEAIANGTAAKAEAITRKALEDEAEKGAQAFQNQLPPNLKAEARADFDTVDAGTVTRAAQTVFNAEDFSDRIWANRDVLVQDLNRSFGLAVTNGWSIDRLAKEFEHNVAVDERSAERIARTEINRVSNAAELAQYRENGIKYYRFIATEDARTCPLCGELHDQVFAVDDAAAGDNFPPVHPNCRCRTVISTVDADGNEDTSWLDDMQDEIDALQDEFDEMDADDEITKEFYARHENYIKSSKIESKSRDEINIIAYTAESWKKDYEDGLSFAKELSDDGDPSGKLMLDMLQRTVDESKHEMKPHPALALRVSECLAEKGIKDSSFITFVDKDNPILYGGDSVTHSDGRIYFRGDAMPHVVPHEMAHRTHILLNPKAFDDVEDKTDPVNIAARADRKTTFKDKTPKHFEPNGEFDKEVMKALVPENTPDSIRDLPDDLYVHLQAFREINASIVGQHGYCYKQDEGCRNDCKRCKGSHHIKRVKLPVEHSVHEFGGNNQEAVAYMAQIQESGNQRAISFARRNYPAIFEQVESLRLRGEYAMKRPEITDNDRKLWAWLDEHVPGWSIPPSESGHAATQESWDAYAEEVKAFARSCKDADEFDEKFLDTVKPLYWPGWKPGKWGGIQSKSR